MGVDQRVVEWLRAPGHDALHLRDAGLHRLPDPQIFNKAIAEQRIVLTFDLDFGEIAALVRGRLTSVILFRLHDTRAAHVIERLASTLAVQLLRSMSAPSSSSRSRDIACGSYRFGRTNRSLWTELRPALP